MTISTTHCRKDYTGNGTTGAFPFDFPILAGSHLLVYIDLVLQTNGVHYNVTGTLPGTGNVVFTGGNIPANGTSIALIRATPRTQTLDLTAGGTFYESDIEDALDRQMMIFQELVSYNLATGAGNQDYGASTPASGTWPAGWIRWNTTPVAGENIGWVCVLAGTPGTWLPFGTISAT